MEMIRQRIILDVIVVARRCPRLYQKILYHSRYEIYYYIGIAK